jgi:DNA transformation protein and related proteins
VSRFVNEIVTRLTPLGPVRSRAMFGGWGLYCEGLCFALVAGTALFLKVNDDNRRDFERRGMEAFQPWEDRPTRLLTFYEVPADVVRRPHTLRLWAAKAIAAARSAKAQKR